MTSNNFKVNNDEIIFLSFTGVVLSQNKYSETRVWSSGGGGHVGPHGGHVAPAQTHSSATTKQEFWLKLDDGKEKSINLSGYDIPIRGSQKISVLMAQTKTSTSAYYVTLLNYASGTTHTILGAESILEKLINFYPNPFISLMWFLMKLIFLGVIFVTALIIMPEIILGLQFGYIIQYIIMSILFIGFLYVLFRVLFSSREKKFIKPLSAHIARLSENLTKN